MMIRCGRLMARGSGLRRVNLLTANRLSSLGSFSRNSPAIYQDTALLTSVGNNVPRFNRNTLIAQNFVANPRGEWSGATPAFPSLTGPNGWSNGGVSNGVTVQYAGSGANDPATGLPYTDVQWIGTASATGFVSVWPMDLTSVPAVDGQTWTGSLGVQLIAGGAVSGFLSTEARGTAGAGGLQATQQNFTATPAVQRLGIPITIATSGVVKSAATLLRVAVTNGVAINCTLRLTGWQLEPGALVNPVALPPVGQIGPSVLYAGALAGRNMIANPRAEGAVAGTPGTPPTGWSVGASHASIITSILGRGDADPVTGWPYVDVRLSGTPAVSGQNCSIGFAPTTQIPASQNQVWNLSVHTQIIAGSLSGIVSGGIRVNEYSSAGGFLTGTNPAALPSSTATRQSYPYTVANAATAFFSPCYIFFLGTTALDLTVRFSAPQLSLGVLLGAVSLPPVGQPSASYIESGARLLIEESRQNGIRNPRAEGSAAGTPGTLPTNWAINTGSGAITYSVVGTGTEDGIPVFDIAFSGTPTASSTCFISPEGAAAIAAANGQTWTASTYARLVAGAAPSQFYLEQRTYDAGSTLLSSNPGSFVTVTGAALATQRLIYPLVLAQATTAFVRPTIGFNYTIGVPISFTLRVGGFQQELGAFATSLMLPPPGSPAATTRANDLATASLGSWFKTAGTVTNLVSFSEQADQWSSNPAPNDSAVTTNAGLAPDGSSNADLIAPSNTSGSHIRYATFSGAINTTYCYSEFFKPGGYNFVRIGLANSAFGANSRFAIFDLSAGTIVSQDAGANATISAAPNGFFRCSVSATSLGTGGAYVTSIEAIPTSTYTGAYAGDGTSGAYAWGAMANTGTTPGPYIPTTTSSAVSKTATGPGTVIFKGVMPPPVPGTTTGWSLSDGTTGNSIWIYNPTISSGMNGRTLHGGIVGSDWGLTITPIPAGSTVKVALAWDPVAGTMRGCVNGGTVFSATVPIPAGLTTFAEGSIATSRFWNNDIESVDYYPASLSNAQLQALTT